MKSKFFILFFLFSISNYLYSQRTESENRIRLNSPNSSERKIKDVATPLYENDALNLNTLLNGSVNFATATVNNDTIHLDLPVNTKTILPGLLIHFISPMVNSGSVYIQIDTLNTFYTLKKKGTYDLDKEDLTLQQMVSIMFDGTSFQVLSQLNNSCPTGFVKVTDEYCISTNETDSVTFWTAIKNCGDFDARVCNWGEWYYACTKRTSLGISGMIGNYEWVDGGGNATTASSSTGIISGATSCTSVTSGIVNNTLYPASPAAAPLPYRCCYSLRKND